MFNTIAMQSFVETRHSFPQRESQPEPLDALCLFVESIEQQPAMHIHSPELPAGLESRETLKSIISTLNPTNLTPAPLVTITLLNPTRTTSIRTGSNDSKFIGVHIRLTKLCTCHIFACFAGRCIDRSRLVEVGQRCTGRAGDAGCNGGWGGGMMMNGVGALIAEDARGRVG